MAAMAKLCPRPTLHRRSQCYLCSLCCRFRSGSLSQLATLFIILYFLLLLLQYSIPFRVFFAVSRPASRFRFYSATAVAMMIMMDNCEGLIMMTLCVMRKLARTELDPASSQLNSTRRGSTRCSLCKIQTELEQSRAEAQRESFTAGRVCQVVTALSGAWQEPEEEELSRSLFSWPFVGFCFVRHSLGADEEEKEKEERKGHQFSFK